MSINDQQQHQSSGVCLKSGHLKGPWHDDNHRKTLFSAEKIEMFFLFLLGDHCCGYSVGSVSVRHFQLSTHNIGFEKEIKKIVIWILF